MLKPFVLCLLLVFGVSHSTQGIGSVPEFSASDPSCACIAKGKRFAQGEEACIGGTSMVCGMNQNVTAWKSLGQPCQISSLFRAKPPFTPM
jgi:hypothetical protein